MLTKFYKNKHILFGLCSLISGCGIGVIISGVIALWTLIPLSFKVFILTMIGIAIYGIIQLFHNEYTNHRCD